MTALQTPISDSDIAALQAGDLLTISGVIYCGRDAVLPKLTALTEEQRQAMDIGLHGSVIFHTAVSPAGVGPTSSNKEEIEESFEPLCKAGVKLFLGKGALKSETVAVLDKYGAVFAIIPPVTALLEQRTLKREVAAFPEEGMEAFYRLTADAYPAIAAVAHGVQIGVGAVVNRPRE